MKNYQRLNYKKYFIQMGDDLIACTKADCFASAEQPSPDNPLKQRWYYAEDRSIAIRIERSEEGHEWFKAVCSSLRSGERWEVDFNGMVHIDAIREDEDGVPFGLELSCYGDVESIVMRREELRLLFRKLDTLTKEYQKLWNMVIAKVPKKEIAKHFNITVDGVYYREQKLYNEIRKDEALKNWFKKD